jgi:hypothetical protein
MPLKMLKSWKSVPDASGVHRNFHWESVAQNL